MQRSVTNVEVGKHYLKAEFHRLFPDISQEEMKVRIDQLEGLEFWRLLEAMSFSFRVNGVFWHLGHPGLEWQELDQPVDQIVMTGMSPIINKVIFSPQIQQDPIKFKNYLEDYFAKNLDTDPEGLDQFRISKRDIVYPHIIVIEKDDKSVYMIDGSNRLIAQMLSGAKAVKAYKGVLVNPKEHMKVGDSTFWLLRYAFQNAQSEEGKKTLIDTTRYLMKNSSDGIEAVKKYWVDHVRDPKVSQIGRDFLKELEKSGLS